MIRRNVVLCLVSFLLCVVAVVGGGDGEDEEKVVVAAGVEEVSESVWEKVG